MTYFPSCTMSMASRVSRNTTLNRRTWIYKYTVLSPGENTVTVDSLFPILFLAQLFQMHCSKKTCMYSQWKMKVNRLPFIRMHWCLTHCYRVFGNPQLIYMGMVWVWVESPSNTPQAQGSPPASNPNTSWPLVTNLVGDKLELTTFIQLLFLVFVASFEPSVFTEYPKQRNVVGWKIQ